MYRCYLEKQDATKNENKFYAIYICVGIFQEWAVVREWGRIGSPGTVRSDWYATLELASHAVEILQKQKLKRGYSLKG